MDLKTYQELHDSLNTPSDVGKIYDFDTVPSGVQALILKQKIVRRVMQMHGRMKYRAPMFVRSWQKGNSILQIAKKNDYPPVLIASILLREMGYTKRAIANLYKNPSPEDDMRLHREIKEVQGVDYLFSYKAHEMQTERGVLGEAIIGKWLDSKEIGFLTENDLRKRGDAKTPDFLLKQPMNIEGCEVSWIESKALFGDEKEHERYLKKQFGAYEKNYGHGMVVYWYGFLETVSISDNIVADHTFFNGGRCDVDVQKLLEFTAIW